MAYNVYSFPDVKANISHSDVGSCALHQSGMGKITVSAAGDLLIVCLLLVYERRKAAYRTLAPTYFFLYGTGRFCIEFLRDDPRGSVGALSTSQFISVFVVILSAVLYWWEGRKHQKAASHP